MDIPVISALVSALIFVPTLSVIFRSATKTHGPDHERPMLTQETEWRACKTVIALRSIRLLCTTGLVAVTVYQIFTESRTKGLEASWLTIRLAAVYVSTPSRILCITDAFVRPC